MERVGFENGIGMSEQLNIAKINKFLFQSDSERFRTISKIFPNCQDLILKLRALDCQERTSNFLPWSVRLASQAFLRMIGFSPFNRAWLNKKDLSLVQKST